MLATLVRAITGRAAAVFLRLERRGPGVPPGPVIIAANHPNSLLDPLVVFRTAGRHARPLAKAPLFDRAVVGRLLRALGGIPVYRREDDPGQVTRNEEMFRAAVDALLSGDAIQIFPEGRSHSDPALSPLRTGAARMALQAEAAAGWTAGVSIVPLGLTYERKPFFRGRAVALYGEPIPVGEYRDRYRGDAQAAARELTDALTARLLALTLNLTRSGDAPLVEAAERMFARGTGALGPREPAALGDRLPRLQAFARGLAWLRVADPQRFRRLARDVRRYDRVARRLGVGEGDVPERYRAADTARWALRVALPTALLAPAAAIGVVAWYLPYRLVGSVVARMRLPHDVIATYKLGAGLLAMPVFWALWTALAAAVGGWTGAAVVALALPPLGLIALEWRELARRALEDARLFTRLAGRRDRRERMAAERRRIVAEFEELHARMSAEPAPR